MNLNKTLIAQRFAKAGQSYAEHAVVQQKMSQQLCQMMLKYCSPHLPRVFEIGCGSGNLTYSLYSHFQIDQLYLNDLYREVTQHFAEDFSADWLIGDVEQLALPHMLDAIVSSSAVQWIMDLPGLLQRCHTALNPQGWLCFSSFGPDNFLEIRQLTGQGLEYWALTDWQHYLAQANFEIVELYEQHLPLWFESPGDILQHLKVTGVTATTSNRQRWNKKSLTKFYQDYQYFQRTDQQYPLTYHPIYCVARRKT